ncbi:MAG TPA: sigma-54 dependent transcriptional regulator, partial [Polyangia bacterium]|nr:sigma-54 dependent transcriptional regulator [Polyangia bacterium]
MADSRPRILVVDDNPKMVSLLVDELKDAGYAVDTATGGEQAVARLRAEPFDLVITDLRMEKVDGLDVLRAARAVDEALPVMIMTAFGAVESAVDAIHAGAYHYFTKPFKIDEVLVFIGRAVADRRLRDENRALRKVAVERNGFASMVGRSDAMRRVYDAIERVAPSPATALVRGESGVGKELVARALHFAGPRREGAFVAVNCTALPEPLLESELFGHVRGAFTGAASVRRGLLVEADRGTLFLDEIGDMPAGLQPKLLRVLEVGEVRPVGADAPRKIDVRVVAATNQDLERRVQEGSFRADLFYRLNVVQITVPPLRDRVDDIPVLLDAFLAKARARNPTSRVGALAPNVIRVLSRCPWPGNVRELENVVERLVIMSPGTQVEIADVEAHAPFVLA